MNRPIQTAFVGIGWWGTMLADAALRTGGAINVAAGCGLGQAESDAFANRFDCAVTDDFSSVIGNRLIDAVVLATPHLMHADQIAAAAQAGKHVLIEKPLATTLVNAIAAVRAARSHSIVLAVGHNRRLLSQVGLLEEVVRSGSLGRLLHVEANFSTSEALAFSADHWRASREQCPGGAMTVLGVHVIDWLHHLFGPIATVSAEFAHRGTAVEMDDVASARLSFASGLSANLVCLYSAPYTNRFVIHGTDATLSVVGVAPESEDDRPVFEIVWASGEIQRKAVPYVDTLAIQLQMFAQAIRGRGRPAVCGEQGGSNVAVLDAVTRSAQASGDKQIVDYGPFRPIHAQEA